MTEHEPIPPKCGCGHSAWRHVAARYRCTAPRCECTDWRAKEEAE